MLKPTICRMGERVNYEIKSRKLYINLVFYYIYIFYNNVF